MAIIFDNKFNVFQEIEIKEADINSELITFCETYLNSDVYTLHPEYLFQLVIHNKITNIDDIIIEQFKNYLKKIKLNMIKLIKKDNFNLILDLTQLIIDYRKKIDHLYVSINIKKYLYYDLFHNIILTNQQFVNFMEREFYNLIEKEQRAAIKTLIFNVNQITFCNNKNYIWFLKLIGIILKNNIPVIKHTVIHNKIYELKILIDYIMKQTTFFNFLKHEKEHVVYFINDIFIKKLSNYINNENNFEEFCVLIEKKLCDFNFIIINETLIKSEITYKILNYINKNKSKEINFYNIIKIFIKLKEYNLLAPELLLLMNNSIIYNNIHVFINDNICNVDLILKLVPLLINIKDNMLFLKEYHYLLIKRLLSSNVNITNESLIIKKLSEFFGEVYCKKSIKCIEDYNNSEYYLKSLLKSYDNIPPTKIINTSYDSWNIDFNNGFIDSNELIKYINLLNSEFINFIKEYSIFYKNNFNNKKKIVWLFHYGEIEVEYLTYQIKLFPMQLFMLELIDSVDSIPVETLINNILFKNYQKEYLSNILKSLEISGILKNSNNCLTLTEYIYEPNLIEVYYNFSKNLIKPIIIEDLALTKRDILCSQINHYLKDSNKTIKELYDIILKNNKIFTVDTTLLDDTLAYMIKQDYINLSEDNYYKIYY
jgi:hypothetical protein